MQRLSPRLLLLSAAAGLLPALVAGVSAQPLPANFSYTRTESGTLRISGTGSFGAGAPRSISGATDYDALIAQHAEANKVNPVLVRAVIEAESAFNPRAVSRVGAMGLMQLMPGTARELGVLDPFDPAENIRGGTKYLRTLLDRFDGNVELALAAYNAGPGAVERYNGVPPYRETRNYVAKIDNKIKGVKAFTSGGRTIYEVTEVMPDGREIVKFTDTKPEGNYSIVRLRR
jgi:soluble lytic murein transglycosylase-like protein